MQFITILVGLLILCSVSATPTTTRAPNPWSICRMPAVCAARSPRVCGRTSSGMCRRFNDICELLDANRSHLMEDGSGVAMWQHTAARDCRRVREVGAGHAYWCYQDCPNRPVQCRETPAGQHICVRSRDDRACKLLTNRCQLLNNNCFSKPRDNWRQTDRRRCAGMQLGDKPHACRPETVVEITIGPILPTSTMPPPPTTTTTAATTTTTGRTTEPPKEHPSSTSRSTSRT